MKRIFRVEKRRNCEWIAVSQIHCEPSDVRHMMHTVAHDEQTRVRPVSCLTRLPVYNFVPPNTVTKISD